MTPNSPFTKCRSCRSPLRAEIDARLIRGDSPEKVADWLRSLGQPPLAIHGKSIRIHNNEHVKSPELREVELAKRAGTFGHGGDLAETVRDRAIERFAAGEVTATIADGLRAQDILHARDEKSQDRDLMLQLAGLLSGAVVPVAQVAYARPPEIEAEYAEIDAELDALLGDVEAPLALPDRPR